MIKEWFSSKELTAFDGLPSTIQGVNRKARVENWKSRKRSGIQGKAIEYHVDSLPSFVKSYLHAKESPATYTISPAEPLQLWVSAFMQLKDDEKELITTWLMKNGIKDFITFVESQENIEVS